MNAFTIAAEHQDRWAEDDDEQALDLAIDHWHAGLATDADPAAMAECGLLHGQRAELRAEAGDTAGAAADADASVELLAAAAQAGVLCWWEAGLAYHLRRTLGGDVSDLDRAGECLDIGLGYPSLTPEWLVYAYRERLNLAKERFKAPQATPPDADAVLRQIEAADAIFATGGGEHDERAHLAVTMVIMVLVTWEQHPDRPDSKWMTDRLRFARTLKEKPSGWDTMLDVMEATVAQIDRVVSGGGDPEAGLATLAKILGDGTIDPRLRPELEQMVSMIMGVKAAQTGDRRLLRTSIEELQASADPEARLLAGIHDLMDRSATGEPGVAERVQAMLAGLGSEPVSQGLRESATELLSFLSGVHAGAAEGLYHPVDRSPLPAGDPAAAGRALFALVPAVAAAVTRHDVATLRECGDRTDELLAVLPPGHTLRTVLLAIAALGGVALLRDEPGDQAGARQVLRWTEESLATAGGAHHPHWSAMALARAEALRHLDGGDRAAARRWGLAGLDGFAWQVLLQSGTDDAVLVARDAGEAARRVAGWCRADDAPDDLVAALDAGRGLVLHAATTSRTIADRLVEAGRPDLADRWRESAGHGGDLITGGVLGRVDGLAVPGDLRSGVLGRAGGLAVPDDLRAEVLGLLRLNAPEPATTADIRAALVAAPADALIYLLPTTVEQPGAAVIVPAEGPITTLVLPGLRTDRRSTFAGLIAATAGSGRDAGPVGEPVTDQGQRAAGVDDLCRWAWTTAMGPVLRHVRTGDRAAPVRLVLVPTGPLAAVPWHAALAPEEEPAPGEQPAGSSDGRRFAVQDAVISYAVSARAFTRSAREPARDVKAALIVGDPTGDLPFAGAEARAIGRVFHPDGTHLGSADGTGTPQQVLDWITTAGAGPSLLHLACHGVADPARPADARLRLAGGDLTARRLVEASRTAALEVERVFLAACATGVVGADYDEAFSLATAFLSAGAHTVFGSLWRVPDEETSLLMFLVHHYLNVDGCAPVEALHRAQLWMLDRDRQAPAEMPPELRRHCASPRLADPLSWAAFTHQGR